jgi:hypothetical protein
VINVLIVVFGARFITTSTYRLALGHNLRNQPYEPSLVGSAVDYYYL